MCVDHKKTLTNTHPPTRTRAQHTLICTHTYTHLSYLPTRTRISATYSRTRAYLKNTHHRLSLRRSRRASRRLSRRGTRTTLRTTLRVPTAAVRLLRNTSLWTRSGAASRVRLGWTRRLEHPPVCAVVRHSRATKDVCAATLSGCDGWW
jgi:hypothetical protein